MLGELKWVVGIKEVEQASPLKRKCDARILQWLGLCKAFFSSRQQTPAQAAPCMRLLVLFRGEVGLCHRRLSDHGECKKTTPNVGLEPTTLRLRVSCSTD